MAVVWNRLYFNPLAASLSKLGVGISPPNVDICPKPTSSRRITMTFGASGGGAGGRCQSGSDSLYVLPILPSKGDSRIGTWVRSDFCATATSGKASIAESYASDEGGDLYLINSYIPEYNYAGRRNHEPRRPRKLLLHRREMNKLIGAVQREGMTLVPLRLYFNERGIAKLALALARGKKLHDKRETEKKRDWQRQKSRLMREKG